MSTEESRNELVLKLEKMDSKKNFKDLLLQYDCASTQWEEALRFAVINDRTKLLDEMINCMEEKKFPRNENCMALFTAVWYFKNESAKRLIPYSDVYMGVAAAIDIKNTDAFGFLIDLLTLHEKTKLLDFAILCENVAIIEVLMPKCDYQKVFDSVSRRHRTHMRVCNAAWRKMEELLPKIEWMKAVELKKTLTHALDGEPVSHTVARKM